MQANCLFFVRPCVCPAVTRREGESRLREGGVGTVCGKSHPGPFPTQATPRKTEVFFWVPPVATPCGGRRVPQSATMIAEVEAERRHPHLMPCLQIPSNPIPKTPSPAELFRRQGGEGQAMGRLDRRPARRQTPALVLIRTRLGWLRLPACSPQARQCCHRCCCVTLGICTMRLSGFRVPALAGCIWT